MISKIIWQTYECQYDELPQGAKDFSKTWQDLNPDWEYKYMSADERKKFILKEYGKNWYDLYNSYKLNVVRAELWKYLVINHFGGLYVDLDIICNKKIQTWLDHNNNFFVSSEIDDDTLTPMIFGSSINNPILNVLLNNIKNVDLNKKYHSISDYIRLTCGYTIFTKSIINYLNLDNNFNFANFNEIMYNNIKEKNGICIYAGDKSNILHNNAIKHYKAGHGKLWDNYVGWLTIDWKKYE